MTEINNGDTLRITHVATGTHLHSHPYNYGHPGTSGQQQITAYYRTDYNDLWIVRPPCTSPVRDGRIIRLEHASRSDICIVTRAMKRLKQNLNRK
jgi:dolichyl-phosphate-mannose--protein O-mannosyl transferase